MSTRSKIISRELVGVIILFLVLGGYLSLQGGATERKEEKKIIETPKSVSTEGEDKKLYDYAMKLDHQKDYKNAYQQFQEMVKKYPESDFCHFALGMIWRYHVEKKIDAKEVLPLKGLFTEGEGPARSMIEAEIKYSTAKSMADLEEAVGMWREIIDKYPESKLVDEAQWRIANFYEDLRNYKQAIKEYEKIIVKYPESNCTPSTYRFMARCYCFLKDYDRAIAELRKGIERYPDSFSAPHNQIELAGIYSFDLKNYPQAIIEYQKVIDNYPNYEGRENVKEYIEKCQLLHELQKKGVNVDEYEFKSPETLRQILKEITEGGRKENKKSRQAPAQQRSNLPIIEDEWKTRDTER